MSFTPRLHTESALAPGYTVDLADGPAHYLADVLRLKTGARVLLFNGRDGEFAATLDILKKRVSAAVGERTRGGDSERLPGIRLYCPVLKKERLNFAVEKAVELGVSTIVPTITEYSTAQKINIGRLRAHAVEAAEQCGRLSVPVVGAPASLADIPSDESIVYFAERRQAPFLSSLHENVPVSFLIGPEGGFSPREFDFLAGLPNARAATLGPLVLRAETAVAAALSIWNEKFFQLIRPVPDPTA